MCVCARTRICAHVCFSEHSCLSRLCFRVRELWQFLGFICFYFNKCTLAKVIFGTVLSTQTWMCNLNDCKAPQIPGTMHAGPAMISQCLVTEQLVASISEKKNHLEGKQDTMPEELEPSMSTGMSMSWLPKRPSIQCPPRNVVRILTHFRMNWLLYSSCPLWGSHN